ncbi:MAG TPA: hypothetical protein VFI70_04005 [Nitrososphaeraceae archaeon]|nr:hypothetical protein [Nitrososphaeraceae archaeon]
MIIKIVRKDLQKNVVLNKMQMAMRCAPRTYEIKEAIAELRSTGQLPLSHTGYKLNYEGIKRIYAINAAKLLRLEDEKKKNKKNEVDGDVNADAAASNVNNANIMPPVDLVSNLYIGMLKEIIICDYNYVDYNPNTDDLLSLATSVKSRKKVMRLLTKGIEQQNADPVVLDESKLHLLYHPDDDEEEKEERRKVARERIQLETKGKIWLRMEMDKIAEQDQKEIEESEETQRQLNDLSILSVSQLAAKVQERYDEVKLGLKIAHKVASIKLPELGPTYKQLAFEFFPEARTKSDQELEQYIQRIVRAIDAVQIHIITRFHRNRIIRIFPIALPSKVDNVERVFNGYKKKYVDKVLREFITR